MNIFYLNHDTAECAQDHVDKHVVKMPLEYAQLLCTAHRILDGKQSVVLQNGRRLKRWTLADYRENVLYKATHVNHPSAIWVRQSNNNYTWLYSLFVEVCKEYTYRYDKVHKCETKLKKVLAQCPHSIPVGYFTQPTPAMPVEYSQDAKDSIDAYRTYYVCDKAHLFDWTKRKEPSWLTQ